MDVEEDDDDQFGTVQYSERDIVVNTEDDNEEAYALREMVSGGSVRAAQSPRQGFEETVVMDAKPTSSHHINTNSSGHSQLVIDSLKSRIHQLVSLFFLVIIRISYRLNMYYIRNMQPAVHLVVSSV